jgi:hypothetical protein
VERVCVGEKKNWEEKRRVRVKREKGKKRKEK